MLEGSLAVRNSTDWSYDCPERLRQKIACARIVSLMWLVLSCAAKGGEGREVEGTHRCCCELCV